MNRRIDATPIASVALVALLNCSSLWAAGHTTNPAPASDTAAPLPADISPEAKAFYEGVRWGSRPPSDVSDPESLQRIRDMLGKMFLGFAQKISDQYELRREDLGGVDGYWVTMPETSRADKVIVYLHGGGYILGSAQTSLGSAIRITRESRIPVLSIEYRLAPEHPFPAGLDDAERAYRWLLDNGYSADDIAVYGDSAGGGLALALVLRLRDEDLPLPAAVAALSPLTDIEGLGDTRYTLAEFDPVLRSSGGGTGRYQVYAGDYPLDDPLISPVYADYTGYPPMLIQVGTREVLLSDSARLARAARSAGVDVTLDVWEGMWHGWQDSPGLPEGEQASIEVAQFFLRYLD